MPSFKEIANGAPFDANKTIRQLCAYLVDNTAFAVSNPYPDAPPAPKGPPPAPITVLPKRIAELLNVNGYRTPRSIIEATDDQLRRIDGIGPSALRQIRSHYPAQQRPKN